MLCFWGMQGSIPISAPSTPVVIALLLVEGTLIGWWLHVYYRRVQDGLQCWCDGKHGMVDRGVNGIMFGNNL